MLANITLGLHPVEIVLTNPKLIADGTTLQFTLVLLGDNGKKIMELPGWRIANFTVSPPSRLTKKSGYVPTVTLGDKFTEGLESVVKSWASEYIGVNFPK